MSHKMYIAVPILLWAATPLIISKLTLSLPISQINWLVSALSLPALILVNVFTGKYRELFSYKRKDYAFMFLMGIIGIFPYTALYYLAFALSPSDAGSLNIINYTWPVWVIILSVLILKETLTWKTIVGILLSIAGVYLIVSSDNNVKSGNLAAFISAGTAAFFWGLFSILTKYKSYEPLSSLLIYNAAAFIPFSALVLFTGNPISPSLEDWFFLIALGSIINVLGYLFWILALRYGNTSRVATFIYLTPFVALIYLHLFNRTKIDLIQIIGLLLIVSGSLIHKITRIKRGKLH